ncbi:helix-turn-helix transcriptional regulator [Lactobacillus sp. YT155]|uniref:helix-turn-helix transcriptional regulator n=1 Tax=Lactobacillus sp. YT155 TaxID=3060955 RepID=UPI00265D6B6F|nr:helix-turn-helix transcriptional regulator [Lactobacillus sp. YT155]MDO1605415.1 helix-turn-helix transcriptional regulator [Lactobacillus sp. YT155]
MVILNKVQQFRKEKKLTQEKLASLVGVSRKTIVSLEKENYTPSLLLAFRIAEALSVDITEVFSLEKEV